MNYSVHHQPKIISASNRYGYHASDSLDAPPARRPVRHDWRVSSVTRPVKELRGFERVTLDPGERKTVTFTTGPNALSLIDRDMRRIVEPGRFDVMVGTSSIDVTTMALQVG